jgi:hypothetical protein
VKLAPPIGGASFTNKHGGHNKETIFRRVLPQSRQNLAGNSLGTYFNQNINLGAFRM